MSKTFGEIAQFTPLFDEMVLKYGRSTATVYGRVWRRCQGKYGCCSESKLRMAEELKMHPRTIIKSIDLLLESGEIFEEKRLGKTTLYRVTPTKKDIGTIQTPTKKDIAPLPKRTHEDTNKKEHPIVKKKEQLNNAQEHFSLGPRRDKALDDYYLRTNN